VSNVMTLVQSPDTELLVTPSALKDALLFNIANFFFSSRRRHTISYGDWSRRVLFRSLADRDPAHHRRGDGRRLVARSDRAGGSRSEERRVGKGGGAGGVAEYREKDEDVRAQGRVSVQSRQVRRLDRRADGGERSTLRR